jgi:hypothetical protein
VYAPGRRALAIPPPLEGLRAPISPMPFHNVPGEGLLNTSRFTWGLGSLQDAVWSNK